jgi:hypothetical protein
MALDVCGNFEKKLVMTGRDTGSTGRDYCDYVLENVGNPELVSKWESFQ